MFRPAGESDSESSEASYEGRLDPPAQHRDCRVEACEERDVSLLSDLSLAVEAGDVEAVLESLSSVPVNCKLSVWRWGEVTPAGLAALYAQDEVLQLLLEKGGDCNAEGFILLASADWDCDQEKVVRCGHLIAGLDNEDINRAKSEGLTPLMIASSNGNRFLVQWLVEQGAKLDLQDTFRWTALMLSVDRGHGDVARLLLEAGADPLLLTRDGQTAADIAAVAEREALHDIIFSFTGDRGRRLEARQGQQAREVTEISKALSSADLQHLNKHMEEHNVDLESFLLMKEDDMKGLGVEKIGDVKKLVVLQARLHTEEWRNSSLPPLTSQVKRGREASDGLMIDVTTATTMVANISQHARYMRTNLAYIRQQLTDHGERLLSGGSDQVTPGQLELQLRGASVHIDLLKREVVGLHTHLARHHSQAVGNFLSSPSVRCVGVVSLIVGALSASLFLYSRSK